MSIGTLIKKYRKERGLTQFDLADKASMSRSYLGDLERDRYNPSVDTLQRIADVLDVPTSALLGDASILEAVAADNQLQDAVAMIRTGKKANLSAAKQHLIDSVDSMTEDQVKLLQQLVDQIKGSRK